MKPSFLLLISAALILGACSEDIKEETPTTGSIAGSVADRTTGEPVATVNVSISPGGSSTVTGSDGTFTFRNLEEGSYTLTITKEGYKQNSQTVSVRPGDPTSAHLLIERIPAIVTADREVLDFGSNASTNTLSFNIVNPGYVDLDWEIEERCEWITEVKPAKGTLKYGKTEAIVVVIDRELLASGPNEAVIVVRSSNGSSDVKVTAIGAERYVPQLNTLAASEITSSSATLNGEITDAGAPAYTERGFVYSLNSMPTFDNMIARLTAPVTEEKLYSYSLRGLTLGETYYVRAYATNNIGTAYSSNEINFTTVASSPELTVQEVTDMSVSKTSATFNGTVVKAGDPAYFERGFVYSTDSNPTVNNTKIKANGTGEGSFSANVSGLTLNQRYYVRTYAISKIKDSEQEVYSKEEVSFTISTTAPQVSVQAVSNLNVNAATATLNGTVENVGDPAYTERGFVYGTVSNPTVDDTKVKSTGTGTGTFSANISGLKLSQQYYVRTYAIYKIGATEYQVYSSGQVTFTLTPTAPSVTVENVTNLNVSAGTATFNGTITNVGSPAYTERGFVYGATRNPTVSDTKLVASGTGTGSYSVNVSSLEQNKTYYVRAYAIGTTGTVYSSEDISFSLKTVAPTITVQAVSNINVSAGTATFNGTVTNAGTPAYTERGFVYAEVSNPTIDDTKVKTTGTGIGTFTANISGLKLSQTYYVRTYAIYKVGETEQIVYSPTQEIFKLTPTAPSVSVENVTNLNIIAGTATFNGTITNAGTPAYTERGFVYGTTRNPTIYDTKLAASGTGAGAFSLNVSNLELNKTYYVRSYVIGSTGIIYSQSDISFILSSTSPKVTVQSVSNLSVGNNAVTFNGTVEDTGTPPYIERGFVYSTSTSPTLNDANVSVSGNGTGSYSIVVRNLQLGEKYYVRAYANSKIGNTIQTVYSSNQINFIYDATLPNIRIDDAIGGSYTTGSARFTGTILSAGDPTYTEKGFIYGLNENLLFGDNNVVVDGNDEGAFSATVEGLSPGLRYYVKAYAINRAGVAYSSNYKSFYITSTIPSMVYLSQTVDKTLRKATLQATISGLADPPVKEVGFVYSTTSSSPTLADNHIMIEGQTSGDISATLSIDLEKTYYWRVYIVTNEGTSYSSMMSFSTTTTFPTITTLAATNENATNGSVTLNGNITKNGDPTYTEKGFVYSSSNTLPTINDSKISVDGTSTGKYSVSLSGLQTNTFYYVRAYAINVKGVIYGDVIQILGPDYYTYPSINLEIQKSNNPASNWNSASNSCNKLTLGGKTGWHLPTLNELGQIYSQKNEYDSYNNGYLWTSTSAGSFGSDGIAYYVFNLYSGVSNYVILSYGEGFPYRCVRNIK